MWDNNRNATIYELNDASMIRASTRIFIVDHAAGLHLDRQVLESSPRWLACSDCSRKVPNLSHVTHALCLSVKGLLSCVEQSKAVQVKD